MHQRCSELPPRICATDGGCASTRATAAVHQAAPCTARAPHASPGDVGGRRGGRWWRT